MRKEDIERAKNLYRYFWQLYPGIPNPSEINTKEKFDFLKLISYQDLALMQRVRKQGAKKYPFVQERYFLIEDELN